MSGAARVLERCDVLGAVSEEDGRRVFTDPFPAQGLITLTLTR